MTARNDCLKSNHHIEEASQELCVPFKIDYRAIDTASYFKTQSEEFKADQKTLHSLVRFRQLQLASISSRILYK